MDQDLHDVTIQFCEAMSGHVAAIQGTFADGHAAGKAAGHRLTLAVTVTVSDIGRFLADPQHRGALSGAVHSSVLGDCPVEQGVFRLLAHTADQGRKVMGYRVFARTPGGEPFTLAGEKQVQHDAPLDTWHDTTTLYVNLFKGHVPDGEQAQAELWMTGIIGLGLTDFLQVLRGMRSRHADGRPALQGLAVFTKFFAGSLWEVYGPSLPSAPEGPSRRYPRFTTEGVQGARISVHPFATADGLTLTLTRFQRGECKDVVLIVHGLTSSSDMFIMPEHRNLVQTLLDAGYGEVWALDYRGSCRFPYNLARTRYTFDDIALYDHPAALAELRRLSGKDKRIHVIAHCVGALTMAMAMAAGTVSGIASAVLNSVALTPRVPGWSRVKLALGPWASDWLLGIEYYNPSWRRAPGWSAGKLLAWGADLAHQECRSPECHMLSFMWGAGKPALFHHANLDPVTHERLGDLFGGVGVHYYRHVHRMVRANSTAVKFSPGDPRYAARPDDYLAQAARLRTPLLLIQGQDNRVFADSNIVCHERLEKAAPGRHRLHVFPAYGHQDIFMGRHADRDVFPRLLEFLDAHAGD
ncbi:MAG: alpha/beta fold hydrolase [Rhodoferax sp.]